MPKKMATKPELFSKAPLPKPPGNEVTNNANRVLSNYDVGNIEKEKNKAVTATSLVSHHILADPPQPSENSDTATKLLGPNNI